MGVKATVKSSWDITPDDLNQHSVILLGSPFQNVAVAQFLKPGDFSFKNPDSKLEEWRGEIINAHPEAGDPATYHTERDPTTQTLETDYSLISIQPGVTSGRFIAVIGGLDTKGTQGATRFMTSRSGIEQIFKSPVLSGENLARGTIPSFQALVRVHLAKGYQVVNSDLITVHRIGPTHIEGMQSVAGAPRR
jgi:hypothetical protein